MTWTPERLAIAERAIRHAANSAWQCDVDGFRGDLRQAVWLRLLQEDYDDSRGVPFSAWVSQRARWAIQDMKRRRPMIGWCRPNRRITIETCSLDALSHGGDPYVEMFGTETPVYHDPFLAQRIRAAFQALPVRLRSFLLAKLRRGGRRQMAERYGVNESRGSQLADQATERFRAALKARGVAA